jgi:hypothetical protein
MIIWDKKKEEWLLRRRNISFECIKNIIEDGGYITIINNPMYQDQKFFILNMNDYTYVVPFEEDAEYNIILKTAYPSRKYHAKYRKLQ